MRWSFGDPDATLTRTMPSVRWMFTRWFAVHQSRCSYFILGLLANRWPQFLAALSSTYSFHSIGLANVVTLWIVGGFVILIHELGHGYTCKHFGGEVRELGFMLIYFQPAFFCNVSDAWSFRDRSARLWVTAAGSWIQMVVASIAAVVWWAAAPGTLVAEIALAAMLVGGVTTLFTNANPLLPLDGYFALSDWLEIPIFVTGHSRTFSGGSSESCSGSTFPNRQPPFASDACFSFMARCRSSTSRRYLFSSAMLVLGWANRALGALGVILGLGTLLLLLWKSIVEWTRVTILAFRARGLSAGPFWRRAVIGLAAILVVLALVPWTLTSPGQFVVHPLSTQVVTAPDSGIIAQVSSSPKACM